MSDRTLPPFSFKSIGVADLHPDPSQPRKKRNEHADKELAESMRQHGMLQTILVRDDAGKFTIINGERRWGAATSLEWTTVDCLVTTASSEMALTLQLIENVQRDDLSPDDLAAHLNVLMAQHQEEDTKSSMRVLAALIGKSHGWVSEKLALSRLSPDVQSLKTNHAVKNSRVLISLSKLQETHPEAATTLIKEIENGKTVSLDLINEVRGSQRKKRAVGKEKVHREDLPPSMFTEVPAEPGEALPHPTDNAQGPAVPLAERQTPKRERKKKVVDLAQQLGISDDLPPEDLLEAFADAYAKLRAEQV